jgi:hypothetical protein
MTIEQYGSGEYGVRIASDDFVGTYRFATADEAREYRRKNGGRLFRSRSAPMPVAELGRIGGAWPKTTDCR